MQCAIQRTQAGSNEWGAEVQSFVSWLREQHYAEDTVRNYALYARRAEEFLGRLDSTDAEILTDWLRTLPPSAGSWNQGRKALAAWFRFQDRFAGVTLTYDELTA